MKQKITIEDLEQAESGTILAFGLTSDSPDGLNIWNTGKDIHWVAVRGRVPDWAVYMLGSWNKNNLQIQMSIQSIHLGGILAESALNSINNWTRKYGSKAPKGDIKNILDIDDAALNQYRI